MKKILIILLHLLRNKQLFKYTEVFIEMIPFALKCTSYDKWCTQRMFASNRAVVYCLTPIHILVSEETTRDKICLSVTRCRKIRCSCQVFVSILFQSHDCSSCTSFRWSDIMDKGEIVTETKASRSIHSELIMASSLIETQTRNMYEFVHNLIIVINGERPLKFE